MAAPNEVDEITEFLNHFKLSKFASGVKEAGAENLGDLRDLDDEETKDVGIEAGMKSLHQKKFIKACKELRDGNYPPNDSAEFDYFLQECNCMKYKEKLSENGIISVSDLQFMSDDDIKILITDAGLGLLYRKKFIKLAQDYKNGIFIPGKTKPTSMPQPKQPPYQQTTSHKKEQKQQQQQQNPFGGMGMLNNMMGGMNKMMDNMFGGPGQFQKHAQASAEYDLQKQKMDLEKEKIELEKEKLKQQNKLNNYNPQPQSQTQFIAQQPMVYPAAHTYTHYNAPIMIEPTSSVTQVASNETCPKCSGNGFIHETSMKHKTGNINQRCFFCEDCNGCKGKGYIKSTQKVTTTTDVFGHSTISAISSMQHCPKCRGHGWLHTSNMKHKTNDANKRCFFCENCGSCNGTGRIET